MGFGPTRLYPTVFRTEFSTRDCILRVHDEHRRVAPSRWPPFPTRGRFEQREVEVVNGSFVDSFEAMDTHVYRL